MASPATGRGKTYRSREEPTPQPLDTVVMQLWLLNALNHLFTKEVIASPRSLLISLTDLVLLLQGNDFGQICSGTFHTAWEGGGGGRFC